MSNAAVDIIVWFQYVVLTQPWGNWYTDTQTLNLDFPGAPLFSSFHMKREQNCKVFKSTDSGVLELGSLGLQTNMKLYILSKTSHSLTSLVSFSNHRMGIMTMAPL